jgi:hypothetical protein
VSFHNGIPITVVSNLLRMSTPTDSTSRRRAEEASRSDRKGCAPERDGRAFDRR